jgi:hypothetical protein
MKRLLVIASCLVLGVSLQAQELYYALPRTTFTLEVQARQESFFAGPYASFAYKLLNLDVRKDDEVNTEVVSARLTPYVEADPTVWYITEPDNASLLALSTQGLICFADKAEAESATWRFPTKARAHFNDARITDTEKPSTFIEYQAMQTDTGMVHIPVEHKVLVEKNLEDKAADAAEMIFQLRKERMNIITGNTDANFYGNSMEIALRELDRMEKEYMALFEGFTVVRTFSASFEIIPSANSRSQRYLAFRLLEDGFALEGTRGVPYYINLEPEPLKNEEESASQRRNRTNPLHYRVPVICKVSLTKENRPILSARIPVYQLGMEGQYPNNK